MNKENSSIAKIILKVILCAVCALITLSILIRFALNNTNLFILTTFFIIIFLVYLISFCKEVKESLDDKKIQDKIKTYGAFSILFAGIAIMLTIIINLAQSRSSYIDTRQALLSENELNRLWAKSILDDELKEWFYWNEFSLLNYKPNLSFILRNNSEECQVKYLHAINAMEVANNANKALIDLGIQKILVLTQAQSDLYNSHFKSLKDLIGKNASTTYDNLDYIIGHCN